MCCRSMLALTLSSSPIKCAEPPLPVDAYDSVPGLAFASATSSLIVFTGNCGAHTIRYGAEPICVTVAKSRTGSYGNLGYNDTLIANAVGTSNNV